MNIAHQLRPLQDFRDRLHFLFPQRADALFDLLDALSSNQTARSPAELSLNPLFRRTYNSVYDGIQSLRGAPVCDPASVAAGATFHQQVTQLIGARLPQPTRRPFWLFGVDVTPTPRPYARTLADRTFVYQPNPIGANKPVTVGHAYSVVAALPEKATHETPSWVVPLTTERVASTQTAVQVGVAQTQRLLNDPALPFHHALCVEVADSAYGGPGFLSPLARQPNLVVVNMSDVVTLGPEEAAFAVKELIQPRTVIPSHVNEQATQGGLVRAGTRTERFLQMMNGSGIDVVVPLSGVTRQFDGSGRCVNCQ